MDKPHGKIYFEAVTQNNTSNMRPVICWAALNVCTLDQVKR